MTIAGRLIRSMCCLLVAGGYCAAWPAGLVAAERAMQDGFREPARWRTLTADAVESELWAWMESQALPATVQSEVAAVWQRQIEAQSPPIEALASAVGVWRPDVQALVSTMRSPRQSLALDSQPCLTDPQLPEWVRQNLNLLYGRWLANHDYLEEARDCLARLSDQVVADPPMLFFYRGLLAYRLLEKPMCLQQLQPLMDHAELVPRRYVAVSRLMVADIQPVESDTLDEVSRIMDRIRLRLGLGRAGTRVRQEEEDVVAKLDKMIDELEQQLQEAQQQQSGAGGSAGGNSPSSPMQDSMPGGASGPGDVDRRDLGQPTDWGNLPPRQREEALQQLGEDVPSHYRNVIEEYFRTLARDGAAADGS